MVFLQKYLKILKMKKEILVHMYNLEWGILNFDSICCNCMHSLFVHVIVARIV